MYSEALFGAQNFARVVSAAGKMGKMGRKFSLKDFQPGVTSMLTVVGQHSGESATYYRDVAGYVRTTRRAIHGPRRES